VGVVNVEWCGPIWLKTPAERLGLRLWHRPVSVSLYSDVFDDSVVTPLSRLPHVRRIQIESRTFNSQAAVKLSRALPGCEVVVLKER
jgi:hypothetical protein